MLEILVRASFEGAILVAMIWALCRCLPRLSAATRTVLWWCAAAKFVLALVWTAPVHIPICGTDEIADVTGAGDTVIAVFTLALAVGATFLEAARLSNYAGGIVVMKRGTATVTAAELEAAVLADRSRDS